MAINEKIIYIIQTIEDIRLEPKRDREFIDKRKIRYPIDRYFIEKVDSSLEMMDKFKKFLEKYKLKSLELDEVKEKNKEFIQFVLKDRIKKRLVYKFIVNLNNDYQLFFFPECPKGLVYKIFIVITTTLNNIENDMIKYLTFIKNSEFRRNIELDPEIHSYIKINPKNDFINTLVEKLSFSEDKKLYRLKLDFQESEEELDIQNRILIGEEYNYLSSRGLANDLNYILVIKEYYKKVV